MRFLSLVVIASACFFGSFTYAVDNDSATDPIHVEMLHHDASIKPGQPFWVAFEVTMDDGWHGYWKNPGDTGSPFRIDWDLPEGYSVDNIEWPTPHRYVQGDLVTYGYEDTIVLLARVTPPHQISGDEVPLKACVRWVACSGEECRPGSSEASTTLPIRPEPPVSFNKDAVTIDGALTRLPQKLEAVVASESGDLIQLDLPDHIHVHDAYFCPEDQEMIDTHHDALVTRDGSHDVVILKRGNATHIKGILVADDVPYYLSLPVQQGTEISMADPLQANLLDDIPEGGVAGFWLAFGLAFLGGVILNLMPCVLPVVSFKIMSFIKMAGEDRKTTFKHGLAYTVGVLCSFWLLAGALLTLQAYGNSIGWGFQLQNPGFISVLIAIIFTFGLSLLGVFEMGTSLTSFAGKAQGQAKEGLMSSGLSGVLATIVATPCTGPFLGSAVGIATTLSTPLALLVFTSLGFGMAFPYLLLSAFPSLLRFMPKPGNWMITFKEITGFFMMATVLWLIWVFNAQTNSIALIMLLTALLFFAVAGWVFGKWGTPVKTKRVRRIGYIATMVLFLIGGYMVVEANSSEVLAIESSGEMYGDENWKTFSPELVAQLRAEGKPIFIDFTAKWCITCQVNHAVLVSSDVERHFQEQGIVRMKADWTSHDEVITEELRKFGRNSVPLYVYYPADPNAAPVILPQMLTASTVIDTINDANEKIVTDYGDHR